MIGAWTRTCAASWLWNVFILLWRMNLKKRVVAAVLAWKETWSSNVAPKFFAVQAGDTRVLSGDGQVVDRRCLPWKEEQLSLVEVDPQMVCRHSVREDNQTNRFRSSQAGGEGGCPSTAEFLYHYKKDSLV